MTGLIFAMSLVVVAFAVAAIGWFVGFVRANNEWRESYQFAVDHLEDMGAECAVLRNQITELELDNRALISALQALNTKPKPKKKGKKS